MDAITKKKLQILACKARMGVLEGTFNAKSGHPGGSLSICDVLTYLYFCELNVDPADPDKADRDRFVLSKGALRARALRGAFSEGLLPLGRDSPSA